MWIDRVDAGEALARILAGRKAEYDLVVGLPRGGVVLAGVVAARLELPLDVVLTRKIGAPGNPEYGIGSVAPDGEMIVNQAAARATRAGEDYILRTRDAELATIAERESYLKAAGPRRAVRDKSVLVVDDGLATGVTARAAALYLKRQGASKVTLAVPVAAADSLDSLRNDFFEIIALEVPARFGAVGAFYQDFSQTNDAIVLEILTAARLRERNE
jgi:predicted phosphoribosyltransferase